MSTDIHESAIALEWLMSRLANDATLSNIAIGGVHRAMAPSGTVSPWVIIGAMSGTDTTTMQGIRIFSPVLFQVKIVGPAASMPVLVSGASVIDQLLNHTSGTTDDGYVLSAIREQPLLYDELVSGTLYTNIGGLYRTIIQQFRSDM